MPASKHIEIKNGAFRSQHLILKAAADNVHGHWTNLSTASVANSTYSPGEKLTTKDRSSHKCMVCFKPFASRNALFRHVRSDPVCSIRANSNEEKEKDMQTERYSVAFKIAYHSIAVSPYSLKTSEAAQAGLQLCKAVEQALSKHLKIEFQVDIDVNVLVTTQTSIASQRHKSLSQEIGSAAAGDVITLSFAAPPAILEHRNAFLMSCTKTTKKVLDTQNDEPSSLIKVRILASKWLPPGKLFHSERHCTQRVYHYLFPLRWLPDGTDLEQWWLLQDNANNVFDSAVDTNATARFAHKNQPPSKSLHLLKNALRTAESITMPNRRERRKSLQRSKTSDVLDTISPVTAKDAAFQERLSKVVKVAKNRHGALGSKERRAFHNFADPNLRGDASPNQEPVWRVIDRARIVGFQKGQPGQHGDNEKEDVVAVIEIRGDDFLREQVRRVVGAALAISHGWLPANFLEIATSANIFTETPIAPPGRLYLNNARFHFDNYVVGDLFLEDSCVLTGEKEEHRYTISSIDTPIAGAATIATNWIQEQLLKQKATDSAMHEETRWLKELRDFVAPRIRSQIMAEEKPQWCGNESALGFARQDQDADIPEDYVRTLALLQNIVASSTWPDTSIARKGVIRSTEEEESLLTDSGVSIEDVTKTILEPGITKQSSGSFTVINPKFREGLYKKNPPLGNKLFPDLVDSVFELEEAISRSSTRVEQIDVSGMVVHTTATITTAPPVSRIATGLQSSHCAINCNAQFMPHVDSGRGAGQSLSMIVGLGSYVGGELAVEGNFHNIRYGPLEFDGWKLRHWTRMYNGERFSLVWFTPELTEK